MGLYIKETLLSKLVGCATLFVVMVFAIACGSGGDGNSRTIAGTIDGTVVSIDQVNSGEYQVWAVLNSQFLRQGTLTAASTSGSDHSYSIDGLKDGTEYAITLVRVSGFERIEVLSTSITASSSSGTLAKAKARQQTSGGGQMNVFSTYISQRARNSGSTVSSVISTVFGSSVSSLSDIKSTGGTLSLASSGAGLAFSDPVARAAVTQLTVSVVASVSMSVTQFSANSATISTFSQTITTATTFTAIVSSASSSLSTLVTAAISSSSSTTFSSALSSADSITAAALGGGSTISATTFSSLSVTTLATATLAIESIGAIKSGATFSSATFASSLSSSSGISSATLQTAASTLISTVGSSAGLTSSQITQAQESAGGKVTITTFDLAHATYGSKTSSTSSATNFTINTLSPVFKIVLNSALTGGASAFGNFVNVSIKGGTTTIGNSNLSTSTLVRTIESSDKKTFYLMVKKAASTSITSGSELSPGASYTYTITPASGITLNFGGSDVSTISGTITATNVTFTYPITDSTTDSLVDLGTGSFTGISGTTPTFLLHSKTSIDNFNSSATNDLGILGGVSVSFTSNGSSATALQTGSTITKNSTSSTAASVTVSSAAGLASGATYTLTVSNSSLTAGGTTLTTADLPSTQTMKIQ